MEERPFLVLVCFVWLLALTVILVRCDMRRHLGRIGVLALPFAFTESMFCPAYWNPPFLLDLQCVIGFGIEDLFFVSGLGVAALGLPALVLNLSLKERGASVDGQMFSGRFLMGLAVGAVLCLVFVIAVRTGWASIIAVLGLMTVSCLAVFCVRRDLIEVALRCFVLGVVGYGGICVALEVAVPGVFARYWQMEKLSGILVAGVPMEELLYGGASFALACSLYPALFRLEWRKK